MLQLCRYDSPEWLGRVLVESIDGPAPDRIVDLGCGSGVLAAAALSRWSAAEMVTVDIDRSTAEEARKTIQRARAGGGHWHVTADASSAALRTLAGNPNREVDLVVSNPPYRSAKLSPEISAVLRGAGLGADILAKATVPMDLVFLAQAMQLVRTGGRIAFIIPDSLVTGQRFASLRARLLHDFAVERVIQLPRGCFKGTDAQAYILVLKHDGPLGSLHLERISSDGVWYPALAIPVIAGAQRMDHRYHDSLEKLRLEGGVTLGSLGAEIRRGQLSSVQLSDAGTCTFHTSDFPVGPGERIAFPEPPLCPPKRRAVWAMPGDVLVARVDRRLERKIAFVTAGAAELSDCVLRVRCPTNFTKRVLDGLSSAVGTAQLEAYARGTAARHITAHALSEVVV